MDIALTLPDVIRLEIGDPDFTTPEHIIAAAAQAARDGHTHYAPSAGLATLRALLADKLSRQNAIECAPENVVVTTGACGGLHATVTALLDPGDELLVPDPGWTTYMPMCAVADVRLVPYPLDRARDFALDVAAIDACVTARTRAVVVNSPGNPSGNLATRRDLEDVLALAERRGLWVVSDECYEDVVFEGRHYSTAALAADERVVSAFSFSKSYAMTGWRIGYAVAPARVAPLIAKAQEPIISCASAISQKAAEAALTGPQDCIVEMREAYRRRRDAALALLDGADVGYVRPAGAFYLMVDVSSWPDETAFAEHLLRKRQVAVVPGTAFGSGGRGMVRVSLAAADEQIADGLERLCETLREGS